MTFISPPSSKAALLGVLFRLLIILAIGALVPGCISQRSDAWNIAAGSLKGKLQTDQCLPYAQALDKEFTKAKIPHTVAYIQWRSGYNTFDPKPGSTGLHAFVLYKDSTTPDHPWWGVDNEGEPMWLKSQTVIAAAYEFGYSTGVDYVRIESIGGNPQTRLGAVLTGKRLKKTKAPLEPI